jgi:ribonuclease HI
MIPLHQKAKEYMVHLKVIGFTHVLREFNKRADELANAGIDNHKAHP